MKYVWVASGASYRADMNRQRPWAVGYRSPRSSGIKFFETLDDALAFIAGAEMEFPF